MSSPRDSQSQRSPLLEDASVLLQFSKKSIDDTSPVVEKNPIVFEQKSPVSQSSKEVLPSSNPGPAVAALSVSQTHSEPDSKQQHSMKAIVAAAALAAAASTPLPLTNKNGSKRLESELPKDDYTVEISENETIKEDTVPIAKEEADELVANTKTNKQESPAAEKPAKNANLRTGEKSLKKRASFSDGTVSKVKFPKYAVDPDAGTIDCICQVNEDDGFTIQCDKCFRWQHASCFNIVNEEVPDIYYCERCDPKSFESKSIDIKRMREIQLNYFKKESGRPFRSYEDHGTRKRYDSDGSRIQDSPEEPKKKRKTVTKERNESRDVETEPRNDTKTDTKNEKPKENSKEKSSKERPSRKKKKEDFDDNTNEELITRIESAKDDYFYAVYYNLETTEYRNKDVQNYVEKKLPGLLESTLQEYGANTNVLKYDKSDLTKLKLPSVDVRNVLQNEGSNSSSHYKFSGLSNLGLFLNSFRLAKGDLIDEFKGELDYQIEYFSNPLNQFRSWGLPKNYYFFINFFQKLLPSVDGDSASKEHFKFSNLATYIETVTKENLELVPLYMNCKTSGNILRFVRKACYPNCQIVPILVKDGEASTVKFYLQAIRPIERNTELTIGWEFDFNDLYPKLYPTDCVDIDKSNSKIKSNFTSVLSNEEKVKLINQVEFVLSQYKCGCYSVSSNVNNNKCKLLRIKKMGSYFYRSSRKGSKLSKATDVHSSSSGATRKFDSTFIRNRLVQRDRIIQKALKAGDLSVEVTTDSSPEPANDFDKELETLNNEPQFKKVQKRKQVFEHPRKKYFYMKRQSDRIANSRAQLAQAIAANALYVPVPIKSMDASLSDPRKSDFPLTSVIASGNSADLSSKSGSGDVKSVSVPKQEVVKSVSAQTEVKKVKKMSFADFLKHRAG